MKKTIIAVLALAAFAACDNRTVDQRIDDYSVEIQGVISEYQEEISALQIDTLLSQEAILEKAQQAEEKAENKIKTISLKFIKHNKENSAAVVALKEVYYLLEVEDLEKVLESLGEEPRSDEFVQKLENSISSKKATAVGQMYTDFQVGDQKFSDYIGQGKVVLVDFWASWCGPCKREIPNIAAVYEKYHSDSFDVLSVAVWDRPEDTIIAAGEHGVVWNQIIDAQRIPTDIYGIDGIPQIMLFGADGTILKRDLRGSAIEEAVKEALGL